MLEIFAVNFDHDIAKADFDELLMHVSKEKSERIKRFSKFEDSQRTLLADILIRDIACKKLKIKNEDIIFDKNLFGKPYIKNFETFHYNISHSGKWIVCATGDSPLGIDIEKIQQVNLNIAKQYFSITEYRNLLDKSNQEKLMYFYELWTLKESYIKAAGGGLSIPLDSFSISIASKNIHIETTNDFSGCFFKQYDIDDGYKMAVCACSTEFPEEVSIKSMQDLLEEFTIGKTSK